MHDLIRATPVGGARHALIADSYKPHRASDAEANEYESKRNKTYNYDAVQLLLAFVQAGTNKFGDEAEFYEHYHVRFLDLANHPISLVDNLGEAFMQFIEFLSTIRFALLKRHSFVRFGYHTAFYNQEWLQLQEVSYSIEFLSCQSISRLLSAHIANFVSTKTSMCCLAITLSRQRQQAT